MTKIKYLKHYNNYEIFGKYDSKKARKLERNPRHKGVKPKILRNYLTYTNICIVVLTSNFKIKKDFFGY